jgi:hypothetical protein
MKNSSSNSPFVSGMISIILLVMTACGVVDLIFDWSPYNSMWFFVPLAVLFQINVITQSVQAGARAAIIEAFFIIEKYHEDRAEAEAEADDGEEDMQEEINSLIDSEGIRRG